MYNRLLLSFLLVVLAPACAAVGRSGGEAPMRSPSLDYASSPAVETSDGQVLGADGMRVEDKLRTSPRMGSEGLKPAAVPALIEKTRPETQGEPDDPLCKMLGMNDAVRNERCPSTRPRR